MELKVNEIAIPAEVKWNYEELKAEIAERAHDYEMMVYTDDQIKSAKEDRANLNKLKKTLNDERIRLEKEYMKPFATFKAQVNEVIAIIDKPVGIIDRQIKEYEEEKKEQKRNEILSYLHTYKLPYDIPVEKLFSERWLNSSVTMKSIYVEIEDAVSQIKDDLETIEEMGEGATAIALYRENLSLRDTLNEIKRQKDLKAAQEKIEQIKSEKQDAKPEPKPEQQKQEWVSFKALLTVEQARMLKAFFNQNHIEFDTI